MLKLCVAGVAGRMGQAIIEEATAKGHVIAGAVESSCASCVGKTLREARICNSDTVIQSSDDIAQAVEPADVYISFTLPNAELVNVPIVAGLDKRIILGTTGFSSAENQQIITTLSKVPSVFSPNFSVGVNILFKLAEQLGAFPAGYDFSLSEIHHAGKKDAPSGTSKHIEEILTKARGYKKTVYGREGTSPRHPDELESVALRAGGVPGVHDVIVAGPYEMLKIEHTAFSRSVFAQGAVVAAEWISRQTQPKVYSMADVLGLC
ncbi:MAG: 4-hydroxy-tetrahydrodipicolinate reductase [Candidatus Bathyarchaeota archaeon]|nr:4-hydroxy-tetrahydrodipicolinate reductase [Candidatus Bathyarchaeota archaeon]